MIGSEDRTEYINVRIAFIKSSEKYLIDICESVNNARYK